MPRPERIMLALPKPPPFCGAEKIADIILSSEITRQFQCVHVDISNNQASNSDRGKLSVQNIRKSLIISLRIFYTLMKYNVPLANVPLSANTFGFAKYLLMLLPCVFLSVKVVSRMGGAHFADFYRAQHRLVRWIIRNSLRYIDCIIVRSENQKNQFHGIYGGNLQTIYLPSQGIKIDPVQKDYSYRKKTSIHVLYLGLISQAKGAFDLLQAIPEVLKKDPRFIFHFVGARLEKERNIPLDHERFIDTTLFVYDKRLGGAVRFYGHTEGLEKDRIFRKADVFICPSYSESGPFSVIEAMEYGLPVVTTRVGMLPEMFQDPENLFYIKRGDSTQIHDALLRVVDSRDIQRMVNRNVAIIEEKLSVKRFEDQMIRLFEKMIHSDKKKGNG